MRRTRLPWGESEKLAFRAAMRSLGDKFQEDAATRLRAMGYKADQGSISEWLRDRMPTDGKREMLYAYIALAGPIDDKPVDSDSSRDAADTVAPQLAQEAMANRRAWNDTVGDISGEILGPRQGRLVDAGIARLESQTGDLTSGELELFRELAKMVGLRQEDC